MGLTEFQSDSVPPPPNGNIEVSRYYTYFLAIEPQKSFVGHVCTVYVSTYLYQQLFSLRIRKNNSERCRLMDAHLLSILKVTSTQNLKHSISELSQDTRCQASGKSDQKSDISVIPH